MMPLAMKRVAAAYALSLAFFVGVLYAVIHVGSHEASVPSAAGKSILDRLADGLKDPIGLVLFQILLIVVLARALGWLFQKIGQPAVIGEMLAGIAMGPSLLGTLAPGFSKFVFPTSSMANLSTLSQVGIILFMFGVGLELNVKQVRDNARSAILVSHMSIVIPFSLGAMASLWLYDAYKGPNTNFLAFALFMGISMSITAFPVLARIIQERKLFRTAIGSVGITAAAVDDVSAWCGLAIIVALSKASSPAQALWTVALVAVFVAIAFLAVKPWIEKIIAKAGPEGAAFGPMFAALICALAFSLITQVIGIHSFFGAFVAGLIIPASPNLRQVLHDRLYYVSSLILVPVFFAFTGLRTQVGLLSSAEDWKWCGLLFSIAVVGKLGGSMLAARISGQSWRDAAGLGALMNTRGLVELIALNVGLDLGVLSPKVFAMLVLMALTTTLMTGPLLSLLRISPEILDPAITKMPEPLV